jgi:hypothetical protein
MANVAAAIYSGGVEVPSVQDDPRYPLYLVMREAERESIIATSFLLRADAKRG